MARRKKEAEEEGRGLLYSWGIRRRRRGSLFFFLLVSFVLHGFAFYLFRPTVPVQKPTLTERHSVLLLRPAETAQLEQQRLAGARIIPMAAGRFLGPSPTESGIQFVPSFEGYRPELKQLLGAPSLASGDLAFLPPGTKPPVLLPSSSGDASSTEPVVASGSIEVRVSGKLGERLPGGRRVMKWTGQNIEGTRCMLGVDAAGVVVAVLPSSNDEAEKVERAMHRLRFSPARGEGGVVWGWAQIHHRKMAP